jgi:hypothetical protein
LVSYQPDENEDENGPVAASVGDTCARENGGAPPALSINAERHDASLAPFPRGKSSCKEFLAYPLNAESQLRASAGITPGFLLLLYKHFPRL